MAQYDQYAPFYDATQRPKASAYRALLQRHHPDVESVLELGCGTGAVMASLIDHYIMTGLDNSEAMLAIARNKLPHARFFLRDMSHFDLQARFDAVICPFGGLNHLLSMAAWQATFDNARTHLAPNGVFAFDINSQRQLRHLVNQPAFAREFDGGTLVMNVTDAGRGIVNWSISVLEESSGEDSHLHRDDIKEIAFPCEAIEAELLERFSNVLVFGDVDGAPASDDSASLCFVCFV